MCFSPLHVCSIVHCRLILTLTTSVCTRYADVNVLASQDVETGWQLECVDVGLEEGCSEVIGGECVFV